MRLVIFVIGICLIVFVDVFEIIGVILIEWCLGMIIFVILVVLVVCRIEFRLWGLVRLLRIKMRGFFLFFVFVIIFDKFV